ncbi:MAG: hypothetical protein QOF76_1679 [Solirubrobacteraceae bacterium]|nr:hypothetical protein [Solirubrobacteraceae bacterium]
MGKRSRKRAIGPVKTTEPVAAPPPTPARKRASGRQSHFERMIAQADARPKPPWHPVPLVELAVLAGIVLIIIGAIHSNTDRGRLAIVFGVILASLAGLDTAVRDHFNGFRSHSTLLATFPTAILVVGLGLLSVPPAVLAAVAIGTFVAAFFALRSQFKAKTGVAFKTR